MLRRMVAAQETSQKPAEVKRSVALPATG